VEDGPVYPGSQGVSVEAKPDFILGSPADNTVEHVEIPWPVTSARTSERDATAPPLAAIVDLIPPFTAR
jgi:hypothetical protein